MNNSVFKKITKLAKKIFKIDYQIESLKTINHASNDNVSSLDDECSKPSDIDEAVELILVLLPTKEIAKRFLVQEIVKTMHGSETEKEFALQSGMVECEEGVGCNSPKIDNGDIREASKQLHQMCLLFSADVEKKMCFRIVILNKILKYFCLGKYKTFKNLELPHISSAKSYLSKQSSYMLGKNCLTQKDYQNAIQPLMHSAGEGHPEALFELGKIYFVGKGTKQDLEKALELFTEAYNKGNVEAKNFIELVKVQALKGGSNISMKKHAQENKSASVEDRCLSPELYDITNLRSLKDLINMLRKMSFKRYQPRTPTWTDALVYSDDNSSFVILIRKNGIDFKYYADAHFEIDFDSKQRISTAGGSATFRHNFSEDHSAILMELAEIARDFVYNREAFTKYISDRQDNLWGSCALNSKNSDKYFDAIIFDLDDTLVYSQRLEAFRGKNNLSSVSTGYLEDLRKNLQNTRTSIDQEALIKLKSLHPHLKMGVLTRSPKAYTACVLKEKYPEIKWDCILAYEDLQGNVKPSPHGLHVISNKLNVNNFKKIILVGDETSDVISSYQAGSTSVIYTKCWPKKKSMDNWRCEGLVPDGIVSSERELIEFVNNPFLFKPMLESWREEKSDAYINSRCIGKFHSERKLHEKVTILGRYFTKTVGQYDYASFASGHCLNEDIIRLKQGDCKDYILACCAKQLATILSRDIQEQTIVCPVPKKQNGSPHMEQFMDRLSGNFSNNHQLEFKNKLLHYLPGAQSNKHLSAKQRFENVKMHLRVSDTASVYGKNIVIFDDVITTGATLIYASHYLREAGAKAVHCVAMAQTISGVVNI